MSKIKSLSFDIDDAVKFGSEEAIMLYNIRYWVRENKARNMNIKEGRVWSYNSYDSWTKLFPFWTIKQVRRILISLEKKGAILVSSFHTNSKNRTKWYTTNEDESICPNRQNPGSAQTDRTSLSNNTTNQTNTEESGDEVNNSKKEYDDISNSYYQWVFKNQLYKDLFDTFPLVTKERLWDELKYYEAVEGASEAKDRFVSGLEKYRQSLNPNDDTTVTL